MGFLSNSAWLNLKKNGESKNMVQVFLPGPKVARYDLPLGSSPRGTLTPPKTDSTQYHPYSDHVGHVEPCLRRMYVFHLTSSRPMPAKRRSEISRRRVCSAKTGGHSSKDQSKTRHQTSRKPWLKPTLGEAGWPIPHNQLPLGPAEPSCGKREKNERRKVVLDNGCSLSSQTPPAEATASARRTLPRGGGERRRALPEEADRPTTLGSSWNSVEAGWPIPHNQLPLGPAKPSSNQRGEKQTVTFAKESWTLPSRGCSNLCAHYIGKWYARRDTQRSMCSLE